MFKKSLLVLLALSFVFEIYQTVSAFLSPLWVLAVLNIPDSAGAQTLNHITAWFLLLVSALIVLSFEWVRREKPEGVILSLVLGAWWIGIGVGIFLKSGITTNLFADSAKGLLIMVVSLVSLKQYARDRGI